MSEVINRPSIILVIEDIEETRDAIEQLLKSDGYIVVPARSEGDALVRAKHQTPNLILVSLSGPAAQIIAVAQRIRMLAELSDGVPVVIFCVDTVGEGVELEVATNVYVTCPDNFNQLRSLLCRVLAE